MPVITIDWIKGRTPSQKEKLAGEITKAFVEIAGVPSDQVWIVFRDVPRSEWAMGGRLLEPSKDS
jgi:4-oxalocrotonate tautomerase